MIGDTTVDMRAGKAAGAQTVGVLCGFGEEPELRQLGADLILVSDYGKGVCTPRLLRHVRRIAKRRQIPYVRLKGHDGKVVEYRTPDVTDRQIAAGERRQMDCVDCHNRPTHEFFASPGRAVDAAMARGAIPATLPFARRQAVQVLSVAYPDRTTADREIAGGLRAFYGKNDAPAVAGDDARLDQLVRTTQFLYRRSVFPAMHVSWGTHQNNLGHTDAPGCFRCHDDRHKTSDGRIIRQDCELCHELQ